MNDKRGTPALRSALGTKTPWAWAIGTFFGAGLLKPGPGTWGSLAATALWYAGAHACRNTGLSITTPARTLSSSQALLAVLTLGAVAGATAAGIPAATRVERESGREDPGHVVVDEVAGQWLTLAACRPDWRHALLAFALFRLFDITKPWPARKLEAFPEGWGIMLDDLAAGAYGLLALLLIQHWW